MINGLTDIVITKLDVLSGFEKLKVAVAYKVDGKTYETYPSNLRKSKEVEVIYREFDGWSEDISKISNYNELPENCKKYLKFIEEFLECPVSMVSVGPERNQNIYMKEF